MIEKEFQAKCLKGFLNGFGCNTKLLLECSLAEGKRLQLGTGRVLYQRRGVRDWSKVDLTVNGSKITGHRN